MRGTTRRFRVLGPSAPLHIRASDCGRSPPEGGVPRFFAFYPSGGLQIRPSNHRRSVMRFHGNGLPWERCSIVLGSTREQSLDGQCRAGGDRFVIPRSYGRSDRVRPREYAYVCGRSISYGTAPGSRASRRTGCRAGDGQISSRCSIPFLETLALVMRWGIQSGLSSGASSIQAHPS